MEKIVYADVVIIGAGVVGCAIARHLSIVRPGKKIVVLEKLNSIGKEASHKNSGILNFGLHQNPKFLKSKLARSGSKKAVEFMKKNNFPVVNYGMIMAVSGRSFLKDPLSLWSLVFLMNRETDQNINFDLLASLNLHKLEPNIKAFGGIFIPNICVISPDQFIYALYEEAVEKGVEFFINSPVKDMYALIKYHCVFTPSCTFRAPIVINAAGLYADEIARMAGFKQYKIYPWRGEYYEVMGEKRKLVKHLICPAVSHCFSNKEICFSLNKDGRLFIGPNLRSVPRKDFYEEDKTSVEVFLKMAKNFFPQLEKQDLKWAYSGIMPKITNDNKENDFIIRLDRPSPPMVNLIGIESSGVSSAMAIAQYVDYLLAKYF